ncbi:histidine kinase, partial [Mycobacterium tuberculosis]|nr:histidine kinase [Mycobacterium tuberculosis]
MPHIPVSAFPPPEFAVAWCEPAHHRREALMR